MGTPRNSNVYTDIVGTGITLIETIRGDVFMIDTCARSIAEKHTWSRLQQGYARANLWANKKQRTVLLHRLIAAPNDEPFHVDHKNGQEWDCRSENLRPADKSKNACNQKAQRNSTGFKGVYRMDGTNRFNGRVHLRGKNFYVGGFATPEEAHAALMKKRLEIHGEFARHQ